MFPPQPNVFPKTTVRFDDRIATSSYHQKAVPVEKVNVGPGINVDPDVPASGGFHEMYRVMPDNVGAYRKVSLPGGFVPGKDPVGFGTVAQNVDKNKDTDIDPFRRPPEASAGLNALRVLPDARGSLKVGARENEAIAGGAKHALKTAPRTREDVFTRPNRSSNPEADAVNKVSGGTNVAASARGGYMIAPDIVMRWTENRGDTYGEKAFGNVQGSKSAYGAASQVSRSNTGREAIGETSHVGLGHASRASVAEGTYVSEFQAPGTNRGAANSREGAPVAGVKARVLGGLPLKSTGRESGREISGNPSKAFSGIYQVSRFEDRAILGDVEGRSAGPQNTGGLRALETRVDTPGSVQTKGTAPKFQTIDSYLPSSDTVSVGLVPDARGSTTSTGTLGEIVDPRIEDLDIARRQLFGNPLAKDIGCA
jgi:hypothetical protein